MNDSNFDYKGSAKVCDAIRAMLKGFASIGGINSTDAYNLALMGAEIQRKQHQDPGLKEAASDDVKVVLEKVLNAIRRAVNFIRDCNPQDPELQRSEAGRCPMDHPNCCGSCEARYALDDSIRELRQLLSSHVTKSADATIVKLRPLWERICVHHSTIERAEACEFSEARGCPVCAKAQAPPPPPASVEHVEQEKWLVNNWMGTITSPDGQRFIVGGSTADAKLLHEKINASIERAVKQAGQ